MIAVVKDGALWHVDAEVALEVGCHEALIRKAYKDSVGKWTWAVGMTSATGHKVGRYIDNPQTVQHCMNIYAWALDNYADGVREAFKGVKISKAQFAAALSFHWNTGAIKRAMWVRLFKEGNIHGAREAIMNWVTPPELHGRREKERALFFDGKWSNNGKITEYTRLTKNYTPVWSSAKQTDIRAALEAAFAGTVKPPVLDKAPEPDAKPGTPTLTPKKPAPAPKQGGKSAIAAIIFAIVAAGAAIIAKLTGG